MMEELDQTRETGIDPLLPHDAEEHIEKTVQATKDYMKKKTVSLRMIQGDIKKAKIISMQKGISYQTYLTIIIHKIIEKDYGKSADEIIL